VSGSASGRREQEGRAVYLAVTVVALLVAVYLALQVIGFLFKLVFLALAAMLAYYAYRAWRNRR
jgi:threonine/homoserine/homoserine lactone efflux protein